MIKNTDPARKYGTWIKNFPCPTLVTVIYLCTIASLTFAEELKIKFEPVRPLVLRDKLDPIRVQLGEKLFNDVRLSKDNSISCAHCHNLATNGSDDKRFSVGIDGALGNIKAPSVYNSGFQFVLFWNGRANTLEEQAEGPITNPIEMGSTWPSVIKKLEADPTMKATFTKTYSDGITVQNILNAIADFERSLVTLNSPFDLWLLGNEEAISQKQLKGYQLFKSYGCISCHQGQNVGGNMFAQMGSVGNYFEDRGTKITSADRGRFEVTGQEADLYFFRVPSLRLAALQNYFFHDSSVSTLKEAIRIMGVYQLGRKIPDNDIEYIESFINSLVGKHPLLKR
ncbi:MAG: cytochrome B6 [Proteobacteria bacterium]|nr:cytochrome B6 [Pseudomonadota bacterium]